MSCNDHLQPNQASQSIDPGPCPVTSTEQVPLTVLPTPSVSASRTPIVELAVLLAVPTLQIVVEADIPLSPAATEIKRVRKNVFLNQVELVPVAFARIGNTDFFNVTRAKLFVSGHIRKNIEYASAECNGALQDKIADVPFSGFAELNGDINTNPNGFILFPVLGINESAEASFINETTQMDARLDKAFFQNLVKYNEQPFGKLVAANFIELDFSPMTATSEGSFSTLREKIVLDLTVKVLQVQQMQVTANQIIPIFTGLTPPVSP